MSINATEMDIKQYLLAALIEIYRGNQVYLESFDSKLETNLLRDVFSAAISFAKFDESRHVLSNEIFKCVNGECTIKEQIELVKSQTPDVIQAKMFAAAHLIKILNSSNIKLC